MNFLNNGNLAIELDRLATASKILLMFDFDGTISQIVSEPQDAKIDEEIEGLINDLESLPNVEVWIISGRDLDDLSSRVHFKNLIGSHGLECPFLSESLPDKDIRLVEANLCRILENYNGILIESKRYSVSVHYRNYAGNINEIKEIVINEGKNFQITEGKKVMEIRIPGRNKGDVCLELMNRNEKCASLYAGDDITDEDAFRALKETSVTIKIGDGSTSANYRITSISELKKILNELWTKLISP